MIRTLMATLVLIGALPMLGACGGDENAEPAAETTTESAASAVEAAEDAVARHDCDGGCGMAAMPEAQMTEVDGKWYCAGCAAKAKEGAEGSEGTEDGHDESDGHDHG